MRKRYGDLFAIPAGPFLTEFAQFRDIENERENAGPVLLLRHNSGKDAPRRCDQRSPLEPAAPEPACRATLDDIASGCASPLDENLVIAIEFVADRLVGMKGRYERHEDYVRRMRLQVRKIALIEDIGADQYRKSDAVDFKKREFVSRRYSAAAFFFGWIELVMDAEEPAAVINMTGVVEAPVFGGNGRAGD